ncbi:MAG: hypothetical protein KAI47_01960, partial [Deltaproteobacteria bacterium]|nr:hypothetical protein [Deltaproteobacteria bacterium]
MADRAHKQHSWGWRILVVFALGALTACSESTPTTLLVDITQTEAVGSLDELRLSIFSPQGLDLAAYRLPAQGTPTLPSTVVLYPPSAGALRLLLHGKRKDAIVAEGVTEIVTADHTQTHTTLILESGRLPDLDGDGVPDMIDDCPKVADPKQTAPCHGGDAAPDAPHDAGADAPPLDAFGETPSFDIFLPDIIKRCTSYTECDDGEPCTDDRCEKGHCTYGFTVCTYSDNPCHHTPYCKPGVGCVEVRMPNGTPCPDNLYCTINETCQSGTCTTKPRSCPDDTTGCLLGTCDETHNRCTTKPAPVNTPCSRGHFCIVNEKCNSSGTCASGDPRDCQTSAAVCTSGTCDETHNRCNYSPVAPGTACDDQDACTQGDVWGTNASCVAPKNTAITLNSDDMKPRGARSIVVDNKGAVHAIYSEQHTSNA